MKQAALAMITLLGLATWIALVPLSDVISAIVSFYGAVLLGGALMCVPFAVVYLGTGGR